MHFSRSILAAALIGLGVATTHGEAAMVTSSVATSAAAMAGMASTATALMAAVSESMSTAAGKKEKTSKAEKTSMAAAAQMPASTGTAAKGAEVNTHVVMVGQGGLTFSPNNVIAAPGDLVQFQFYPKNHSVVQSTFDNPCVPIQNIMANKTDAFFSGFMPTAANSTAKQLTYTIRVMDTKPVWFYCSQAMHCQSGMVGAINAATSGNKTIDAFKGLAASASENLSPGQAPGSGAAASVAPGAGAAASSVAGGAGAGGGVAATGTAGGAASATTSSANNPAQQSTNAAPMLNGQSAFGMGLGALAALFML